MALEFNHHTGIITYKGKDVGEVVFENGRTLVRLRMEYEANDDWMVPIAWFSYGFAKLSENQPAQTLLVVNTPKDSIAQKFEVPRFIIEKQVKRGGYIWKFHKTDVDSWPSSLHGHEYGKHLVLDAITGKIFDAATRQLCMTLKSKDLEFVQSALRLSKDFDERVALYIDSKARTEVA